MRFSEYFGCALLIVVLACAPEALAQQAQQSQASGQPQAPVPAYGSTLGSALGGGTADAEAAPQTLSPDTTPLTGAQELSLGTPTEKRTYWQPHLDVTATGDSNALQGSGAPAWLSYTSILAGFDVHQVSGRSDLALMYSGGGLISNDGNVDNAMIQQLGFAEKISGRRTTFSLFDQAGYLPETSLGYGGGGSALPAGGNLLGLQPGFLPGGSILTERGQRLTNSAVGEVDHSLSARATITLTGGYSLLHYFGASLLNTKDAIFQGGYNYQLSQANTIGFLYIFNAYRFSAGNPTINDHSAQISYARRLTGELAFRGSVGPELALFHEPASAGGGTGTPVAPPKNHVYGSGNAALSYQLQRTGLSLGYSHGVSAGSGVFAGAITDQVSAGITQMLKRTSMGGFDFGYARNRSIAVLNLSTPNQVYGYWFGGVSWNHLFSRTANLSLGYQVEYQAANSSFCIGAECGRSLIRHEVSMTFGWRARPLAF